MIQIIDEMIQIGKVTILKSEIKSIEMNHQKPEHTAFFDIKEEFRVIITTTDDKEYISNYETKEEMKTVYKEGSKECRKKPRVYIPLEYIDNKNRIWED